MSTIFTIAKLTFREAVRRRIVLAALILGVAFLVLYGTGYYFIQQDFVRDGVRGIRSPGMAVKEAASFMILAGMYVVDFLCIAIAALITADSLAGEIQSGTIQAIMTKPIRRSEVVVGKWLGSAALLFLYLLFLGGGVMLLVRVMSGYATPNGLAGLLLIYFNCLIVMSVTLAFSSTLSTLATGGAVFGAYGLAFIGGWIERIGSLLNNQTAVNLGIFSSLLLPSEAVWSKASRVMSSPLLNMVGVSPFTSGSEPSTLMMVYAVLYLLAMVGLAVRLFHKRDL